MGRKLAGIAAMAALALALLAGCSLAGDSNAIIGSISADLNGSFVLGGTAYHVLVYESTESIDPATPSTVNGLTTVARLDSYFPGSDTDQYWTTNYIIPGVPDGQYYVFVWVDVSGNGLFSQNADAFGFYEASVNWLAIKSQPQAPNVTVPTTGIVDIDVWYGFPPPS
jgi:hypothetical protein